MGAKDGELFIYFEYKAMPKGVRQDAQNVKAAESILPRLADAFSDFVGLAAPAPTEKDKKRTLLAKHLTDYTAKNTSDYFIHKDLKGFLTRELDFMAQLEEFQKKL